VYSNKGKLKDSLGNPKNKTEVLQKSGIYQAECGGCDSVYIGQTKLSLKIRFGEHNSSIHLNHRDKTNIARHIFSKINDHQGHSISLDNLKLVKNELDAYESYSSVVGRKKVL
jgi:hypothetical protein